MFRAELSQNPEYEKKFQALFVPVIYFTDSYSLRIYSDGSNRDLVEDNINFD